MLREHWLEYIVFSIQLQSTHLSSCSPENNNNKNRWCHISSEFLAMLSTFQSKSWSEYISTRKMVLLFLRIRILGEHSQHQTHQTTVINDERLHKHDFINFDSDSQLNTSHFEYELITVHRSTNATIIRPSPIAYRLPATQAIVLCSFFFHFQFDLIRSKYCARCII